MASISTGNKNNDGMESKLLSANPVLEAFGNAKTVRNNNSSRFGKWMELHFHENGWNIVGCRTVNYLLEKVRLTQQGPTERNFHTFYQLLSKSTKALQLRKDISFPGTTNPKEYNCLYQGGCVSIAGMDEAEEFDDTFDAFTTLGFTTEEIQGIYRIVGGILHLSNIAFALNDEYATLTSLSKPSKDGAKHAAQLLMIDEADMMANMMAKTLYIGGDETIKHLKLELTALRENSYNKDNFIHNQLPTCNDT